MAIWKGRIATSGRSAPGAGAAGVSLRSVPSAIVASLLRGPVGRCSRNEPFRSSIAERNDPFKMWYALCMSETTTAPLSGRRAQAARNDRRILDAARAVFTADPGAPISAVAARAGVGIGALYRRYASKEELLRRLCADGLQRYIAEAEAALADQGDPWTAFATFMRRIVDADTHSLTLRLAGTFTPTD